MVWKRAPLYPPPDRAGGGELSRHGLVEQGPRGIAEELLNDSRRGPPNRWMAAFAWC